MCVTINGKLAIIGALYKKQQCHISEINQIADTLITEIDDIDIVLNKVTISDFVNSRSSCFNFDNQKAMIKKIDKNYEFPRKTIEYYLCDISKSKQEKVLNLFFDNE